MQTRTNVVESNTAIEEHGLSGIYIRSLIRKKKLAKRRCLTCGRKFLSTGFGNRVCCDCATEVNKASVRKQTTYALAD